MKESDCGQGDQDPVAEGGDITHSLKAMSADMVRLVLVESRLFGLTALAMIGLSLVMALLLVSSWLFVGAALVMALASLQAFNLMGALLTVALAHLLLAALAFWRLRHIAGDLGFRESRASVNGLLGRARSLVEPAERRPQAK